MGYLQREIQTIGRSEAELQRRGHAFRSESDTEVLLHAYQAWGVECLGRLNGMFGFALWDEGQQRLWLVRYRLGIKPLFYCALPSCFIFASEIKAILCHPAVERSLDLQALAYYLALNYSRPTPCSAGIRQLLPGHYAYVGRDGRMQETEYWDVVYRDSERRTLTSWCEEFAHLLEDAVRLRLVSDVPFGAFLSGGVDSSSIVYWMSRHLETPVNTFTIGFDQESFNELPWAREVAHAVGAHHHEQIVNADAARILPKLVWHAEEPTADSSTVVPDHLAEMTRRYVTVALAGDGADEILAGYPTYTASFIHRLYRHLPAWLRRGVIAPLIQSLPISDSNVSLDFRLKRFVAAGDLPWQDAHATWRLIHDAERQTSPAVAGVGTARGKRRRCRRVPSRVLTHERRSAARPDAVRGHEGVLLPNDMLVKVDRTTMAHGLEAREPYLDYRLVELAASVPPGLKLRRLHRASTY